MNATKLFDLVVKVGEYTNNQGETKARYENIGSVMRNDKGQFAMLKKTFNPAGVPGDRDSILVSMFEPKPRNNSGGGNSGYGGGGQPSNRDLGDDIPFDKPWK